MRFLFSHWRARTMESRTILNALDANLGGALRQQFELSIGCVPFRLQMADVQLFLAASSRYAAFREAGATGATVEQAILAMLAEVAGDGEISGAAACWAR